jgi:cell wall-associated NlpC family hydrolase
MKPFSFTTLAMLLGIAGLAHSEPTKKSSSGASKSSRSVPRKVIPKEKEKVASSKTEAPDDTGIADKPKSGDTEPVAVPGKIEDNIAEGPVPPGVKRIAAVSSIEPEELSNFDHYAPQIKQLVRNALELTKLNLTYTFGSADPLQGGMDCSGTIVHLLKGLGMKGVPRQSNEICAWVQDRTLLHRVTTAADTLKHPQFSALQPGDLLFWSGTYVTAPRKIPVTHVMIYLGKLKKTGKHVVFGASDGRAFQGARRTGVSVFDFSLPRLGSTSEFYGYGLIPAIGKIPLPEPAPPEIAEVNAVDKDQAAVTKEPTAAKVAKNGLKTETKPDPVAGKKEAAENVPPASTAKTAAPASKTTIQEKKSASQKEAATPPNKEQDEEKSAVATKDKSAESSEEVRRAIPAVTSSDTSAATPKSDTPAKAAGATTKKSATAKTSPEAKRSKPQTASSKPSPKKRARPRELTPKEKLENTANRFANSVRNAFGS